jgi:predicted house-cleaning noncanonical NTP pyrophosphatase (MazG superfamily)
MNNDLSDFLRPKQPMHYFKSTTYEGQRKERLLDTLCEYLDDSDVSLDTFLCDLKTGIIELKKHHEESLDKMNTFYDYLP